MPQFMEGSLQGGLPVSNLVIILVPGGRSCFPGHLGAILYSVKFLFDNAYVVLLLFFTWLQITW